MFGKRLGAARLILFVGIGLSSSPALAKTREPAARHRISFTAPAGCPDRLSFLGQVSARVPMEWLSDEAASGREISVTLASQPEGFSARMDYVDAAGQAVSRSLVAPNCAQAAAAIALVTAMALDSENEGLAAPKDEADVPRPERPKHSADSPDVFADSLETDERTVGKLARTMRQEVAVAAGARQGVGPGWAYGASFAWGAGPGPFPLFRLVAGWYETSVWTDPTATRVTPYFRVITLGPELCLGQQFKGTALAAGLCLGADAGHYVAEGTYHPLAPMVWAEAYTSAPVRWLKEDWFVELRPDLRFPFTQGDFQFTKGINATKYSVPRLALALNLGVGLAFQ